MRVIRSGSVAECYLEPLAAIWQSMRLTKSGQGWRRFLVFAELTKSRKGVDYIALFVYFQFKSALIIILAQGPRMAINAITLWAVVEAQLIPVGDHASEDHNSFVQFFRNIESLAQNGNRQETVIYFAMLFSLLIWVIAALSLLISFLFFIFFLWHHVDKSDGSLTKYCRRKIETRLERIVSKKIKKALEKQDMKRRKEEQQAVGKAGKAGKGEPTARLPTLPKLEDDDTASVFSMATTATTLPPYSANGASRSNTMKNPTLPSVSERPVMPTRSDTQGTAFSTNSNAPLLGHSADMGMASPLPPMPAHDPGADYFNAPPLRGPPPSGLAGRPFSPMSQGHSSPAPRGMTPRIDDRFGGPPPPMSMAGRPFSPMSHVSQGRSSPAPRAMPPRLNTQFDGRNSPAPSQGYPPHSNRRPAPTPVTDPAFSPYDGSSAPAGGPSYEMSPVDLSLDHAPQQDHVSPLEDDYRPPQLPSILRTGSPAQAPSHVQRAGTAPPANPRAGLPASLQSAIQRREASQPLPFRAPGTPQQRSATAPGVRPAYGPGPTQRSASTAPQGQGQGQGYHGY